GLQLGVRGRSGPQRMPRGEDLVREPAGGQVPGSPDAPAEIVVSLEDADAPAGLREESRTREGVDSGADEHRVEARHGARRYQRRWPLDMSRPRMTESRHAPARGRLRASRVG